MDQEPTTPSPLKRARARFDRNSAALARAIEDIDDVYTERTPREGGRLVAIAEMERGLTERAALALIAEHAKAAYKYPDSFLASSVQQILTQAQLLP